MCHLFFDESYKYIFLNKEIEKLKGKLPSSLYDISKSKPGPIKVKFTNCKNAESFKIREDFSSQQEFYHAV